MHDWGDGAEGRALHSWAIGIGSGDEGIQMRQEGPQLDMEQHEQISLCSWHDLNSCGKLCINL